MQPSEHELIVQIQNGDIRAFESLYRAHVGMVYGLALRMTGRAQDAEEVAQDVFVAVHKALGSFREGSSLKTWLYRITVNTALNRIRHTKTARAHELPLAEDLDVEDPAGGRVAEEETGALNEQIARLLDLVNPDQRACLVLRVQQNLSYEDIAATLGINVNTVRSRIKRARETLIRARAAGGGSSLETRI